MTRTHRAIAALAAIALTLLTVLTTAAPATADPTPTTSGDAGWMPADPGPLTATQKGWLSPVTAHPGFGLINCAQHRDFGDCATHGNTDDSKGFTSYIYNTETGQYAGVAATAPATIDDDHKGLLNDKGILDCSTAANKIPVCAKPQGWDQSKPMQYDANGRFLKLAEGGTATGATTTHIDASKLNPLSAVSDKLNSEFAKACESFGKFAGDLIKLSMTWWLKVGSINVTAGAGLAGSPAVRLVVMMIIALGIIGSATAMMLSRRPGPAAELGMGAVKFVLISSLSTGILVGAMNGGDDFASQLTAKGADQFGDQMASMLGIATLQNPGGVLLVAVAAAVLGFIQWLFGFVRQAGIVVLYAMLIFAAAGQLSTWGRQWFPRICSLLLALVLYKPAAAIMYSIGFKLMGAEHSLSAVMVGLMVIALCALALPVMLKFFSFISPAIAGGGGAGTFLAGALGGAGLAGQLGGDMLKSFGSSGGDGQSNYMDATGPDSSTTGGDTDPSPGAAPGGLGGGDGSGDGGGGFAGGGAEVDDLGGDSETGPESSDAAGGMSGDSVPVSSGAGGGDDDGMGGMGAAAGAGGAEGGAMASSGGNPYVAAGMAIKDGIDDGLSAIPDAANGMAEGMAPDDTGDQS